MAEFIKDEKENYGESSIRIEQIPTNEGKVNIDVDGKDVCLFPAPIHKFASGIHCYALVEKIKNFPVTMIDIVYGNIDVDRMDSDSDYRKKVLEMLSRENIERITRDRLGVLFPVENFGTNDYIITDLVKALLTVKEKLFISTCEDLIKIKRSMFDDNKPKKTKEPKKAPSYWELLKQYFKNGRIDDGDIQIDENQQNQPEEYDNVTRFKRLLFFPTGATIVNGDICSKFTFLLERTKINSQSSKKDGTMLGDTFLASNINLSDLYNSDYKRAQFAKLVVESQMLEALKLLRTNRGAYFTYAGDFAEDRFVVNPVISKILNELNKLNPRYIESKGDV